jgi:hypothetical protein
MFDGRMPCKVSKKEYLKQWKVLNKEHILQKQREWREANRQYVVDYEKQYHIQHKEKRSLQNANNYKKNKENIKQKKLLLEKSNINYLLKKRLRTRLWHSLKNNQKSGSAVSDLGCSIAELKIHLESLFELGMTWDNYGEWHIDHIKPLSSFDLSIPEQFKDACHYTNLQPLWAKDNLIKGNSY